MTEAASDDRRRSIELLEANHVFPGEYSLSVITVNTDEVEAAVLGAIALELGAPPPASGHERRPSANGKYVSHRLTLQCANAEQVLSLYARLRGIEGIVTVL